LSLLLKVLEGETDETISAQLKLFHDRALPDLDANIRCGNSLIDEDFTTGVGGQLGFDDQETALSVNPFNWERQFPLVFDRRKPGFDAILGNPPYIRVRLFREFYPEQVDYLESHFACATHVWDVYMLFYERAQALTRADGLLGFIVPIQTLHQPNSACLRQLLVTKTTVRTIADLSALNVFDSAMVKNCVIVCANQPPTDAGAGPLIAVMRPTTPDELATAPGATWPQRLIRTNPAYSLKTDLLGPRKVLSDSLAKKSWRLEELCYVTFGLRSSSREKGKGGKERLVTSDRTRPKAKPYLEGRDIGRYVIRPSKQFIRYLPAQMYSPRTPELFETRKIVSQTMLSRARIVATLDEDHHYCEQSLACVVPHGVVTEIVPPVSLPLEFILAVMNSRLQRFFFAAAVIDFSLGGGLIHATPGTQAQLIVPRVDIAEAAPIARLARQLLSLHGQLQREHVPDARTKIERLIDIREREIDNAIYALYKLSPRQITEIEEYES
jgi:hypothetical protein